MSSLNPPVVQKDPFGNVTTFVEAGQMGQYQDSRWSGEVLIEHEELNHEDMIRSVIERQMQEGHIFSVGVRRPFAAPYFTRLEQDAENPLLWKFTVVRDYLD